MESSTATMTLSNDPAASLRAKALSTLKSKRRKGPSDPPVKFSFGRPAPPADSIMLDYGQDDDSEPQPFSASSTTTVHHRRTPTPPPETSDSRETDEYDGSDGDEEPTIMLPMSSIIVPAVSGTQEDMEMSPVENEAGTSDAQTSPSPEVPEHPTTVDVPASGQSSYDSMAVDNPPAARPGINLTQQQFDDVKDIVLDLLGYGVPPEHLVECGVTKETLFYVFHELNLRLPQNLDIASLAPYGTHHPDRDTQSPHGFPRRDSLQSVASSSNHSGPLPTPPILPPPTPDPDLLDIEQRRRAELRARKAVQASRKLRNIVKSTNPSGAGTATTKDTVESFLNSINTSDRTLHGPDDAMVVDSTVPASPRLPTPVSPVPTTSVAKIAPTAPNSPSPNASRPEATSPGTSQPPWNVHEFKLSSARPMRRSGRRPVAADFVDSDPSPREVDAGTSAFPPPPIQRPSSGASFLNLGQRRCVIDLSDSEDDSDSDPTPLSAPVPVPVARGKPPSALQHPTTKPKPLINPDILAQKELEIQKMRELIARREGERLRKLAVTKSLSGSSTPVLNSTPSEPSPLKDGQSTVEKTIASPKIPPAAPSLGDLKQPTVPADILEGGQKSSSDQNGEQVASNVSKLPKSPHDDEMDGSVDADNPTSPSAEPLHVPPMADSDTLTAHTIEPSNTGFTVYSSPFATLPMSGGDSGYSSTELHDLADASLSSMPRSAEPSSFSHPTFELPWLIPFKRDTAATSPDPMKQLCQYELPGDGTCRDANCDDIHRNQLTETGDLELAQYLFKALPPSWLSQHNVNEYSAFISALQQAQQRSQDTLLSLDGRVAFALSILEHQPST